jgi:hypothetical protein
LPSFTQPHFAAATASIGAGLFAYVASLNVERRRIKDGTDDGEYSLPGTSELAGSPALVGVPNREGWAFRVRDAVRVRMAERCGAFASASVLMERFPLWREPKRA